jgi:hypothetical protein
MSSRLLAAALAACLATHAARAADEDNPYKNVKVGDYATFKMDVKIMGVPTSGFVTQTVTAKTDKEATVSGSGKVEANGQKADLPPTEQKIDLTKPFDPTKVGGGLPPGTEAKIEKLKEGKEKLKVAGKEYETTWTTYKLKGKALGQEVDADVKVWMSKDIPMGSARMEMNGKIGGKDIAMTLELTETGSKKP